MQETNFFTLFTNPLHEGSIEYMVTGSAAVLAFGEPRLTNDIDIVLSLTYSDVQYLQNAFPDNEFYCPAKEVLVTEISRSNRGHFNIIHHQTGLKADCYLAGKEPFQLWALARRSKISLGTYEMYFAPLEYVIVKKLEFYRQGNSEKHIRDIRSLLFHSPQRIDLSLINSFVAEFGLETQWALAKN